MPDVILIRLRMIGEELGTLTQKLDPETSRQQHRALEGIWKDIEISNDEIEEVKRSWMRKLDDI